MNDSISFEKINGKNIFTIFSKADSPNKSMVIMNHGFKGSSVGASRSFVNFSRMLVDNGMSVLRFDQPCSGNSEGDFIDSSFNEWVETIVYFAKKYHGEGYKLALLGHSMGANASIVAAAKEELKDTVAAAFLWAPDPKTNPNEWFMSDAKVRDSQHQIYEENGQLFKASYWQEVLDADFFHCLRQYQGKVHLVYGEKDRFVSDELRGRVINEVKNKNQEVMILSGQDHMMWDYDVCNEVFNVELEMLKNELAF